MKSVVYCFSGTGNSLYVAKMLCNKLDAQLIQLNQNRIHGFRESSAEVVGIVFPVYHQGLPNMIKELLKNIGLSKTKYIYGIVTYGDKPTLALEYLDDLLKNSGKLLSRGFAIKMPYNYVKPSKIGKGFYSSFRLVESDHQKQRMLFEKAEHRINIISKDILNLKEGKYEISDKVVESFLDFLNLKNSLLKKNWLKVVGYTGPLPETFEHAIKLMDTAFRVNDRCISCGVCVKICPADNIEYINGKPVFLHNCEQCFACVGFCPESAILPSDDVRQIPYHHPSITIEEMMIKN